MPFLSDQMTLVLLLFAQSSAWTFAARVGPHAGRGAPRDTSWLTLGDRCGVYTRTCSRELRCVPPPHHPSPLQALLHGRGICAKPRQTRTRPTEDPDPTGMETTGSIALNKGPQPSHSGELEHAPCRKKLNVVLKDLEVTVFRSSRDIYIPNCDTRGFYRKKQCRSSIRLQRGDCWCVDEYGEPLLANLTKDGNFPC